MAVGWRPLRRLINWFRPVPAAATPAAAAVPVGPAAFQDFTERIAFHDASEYTVFEDFAERIRFDQI